MEHPVITTYTKRVLKGALLTKDEGAHLALLAPEHTTELLGAAHKIMTSMGKKPFTCSIINAKSGNCSQNCSFCAQSNHFSTGVAEHALLSETQMVEQGLAMHAASASCYSLVTSGLRPSDTDLPHICNALHTLKEKTPLVLSASLGLLDEARAQILADAGLTRYHHNLETAPSYFPQICTTHTYEEDRKTLRLARKHGLEICSGGILGLGENWEQRVELALTLREEEVSVVPLNFLSPIPGTPLEHMPLLSVHDALKSVALFRFMLPQAHITIAGGRERVLGEYQSWLRLAGANGLMIGNYLTTKGRSLSSDAQMLTDGAWI